VILSSPQYSRQVNKMTYSELIQKLQAVEKQTGLDLSDVCVDAENAVDPTSDKS
jgi:hypothetical protein